MEKTSKEDFKYEQSSLSVDSKKDIPNPFNTECNLFAPTIKKPSGYRPRHDKVLSKILKDANEYKIAEQSKRFGNVDKTLEQVDYVWGFIICMSILYNYLLFFFYLGIPGAPEGIALICEIFAELILFIDTCIVTYFYCRKYELLKTTLIDHLASWTTNEKVALIIIWVSSFPQHTVNLLAAVPMEVLYSLPIALLRGLKLLRYPEVWSYFNSQLRYVKGANAIYVKMFQYILNIYMLVHAVAMFCLTAVRLEPDGNWLTKYNFDRASSLEIYSEFLLLATSNMGGMCYGDITPVTVCEILVYCLVVYIGATALASLFGSLANSIYINNQRFIEIHRKLDQIKNFVNTHTLPVSLKHQLFIYYSTMHSSFSRYKDHCALLQQLPRTINAEAIFRQNAGFIEKVRLFQLSNVSFILPMLRAMQPVLCMAGDHIIHAGDLADSMYFIKRGIAKVVCVDDESVVLSYLTEGCYFGEAGILIKGQRSTSVIAQTDCILFSIEKDSLLKVLEEFTQHKKFLTLVGKQRLKTTFTKDLTKDFDVVGTESVNTENPSMIKNVTVGFEKIRETSRSIRFAWNDVIWAIVILIAFLWSACYTFFALCFGIDIRMYPIIFIIDIISLIIFFLDLILQLLPKKSDKKETKIITLGILIELLSTLPIDYIYFASGDYINWLRFLRILKIVRLPEINSLLKSRFENHHVYNIAGLIFFSIISSHIFGCILYVIASAEYERNGRFDHACLFRSIPQKYASFKPIEEESMTIVYIHCLYIMVSIMGSNIFGDVIPLTPLEQFYANLITLVSRIFIAFIYAEVSNFMSGYYSAYIEHLNKTKLIIDWLKYNSCNQRIAERVECYREILWTRCKGIDDQLLIMDMPETLRKKTQLMLFQQLIKNSEIIPKTETGPILLMVQKLSIKLFPKGEFIIYQGETILEMYFIIEGLVDFYDANANRTDRLTSGKSFGEFGVFSDKMQKSTFTAYCSTDASLAMFKKEDYKKICELYPSFKEQVTELMEKREKFHNLKKTMERSSKVKEDLVAIEEDAKFQDEVLVEKIVKYSALNFSAAKVSKTMNEEELFNEINRGANNNKNILYTIHIIVATCSSIYNIIFIPLQMAFRIKYNIPLYCIEVFILILFIIDIIIWVKKYNECNSKILEEYTDINQEANWIPGEKKGTNSMARKKRKILWMIFFECMSIIPWYIILSDVYYPTYLIFGIKMIRALKIWPIQKLLSKLKKKFPNSVRICEALLIYTLFNHVMACSYILMMYAANTKNESWVKRIPYPIPDMQGFRKGNNMTGVSTFDIYCHAIYFAYIIFTHISVGDMCAVNIEERVLMCFYILSTFHIYAFLFANMTSMITDFYRGLLSNLQQTYEETLHSIKANSLPVTLVDRIKDYFDFLWINTRGIDDKFLCDFPISLKTDIYLQIYKKGLENSTIFRKPNGHFDKRAASSFLKLVTLRKYMQGDILVKAGSTTSKLYFVLDGDLVVIGVDKKLLRRASSGVLLDGRLNDTNRQMAYVVATHISTVAVLTPEILEMLIEVFPYVKDNSEKLKEKMFGKYKEEVIPALMMEGFDRLSAEKFLVREYTSATESTYDKVLQVAAKEIHDNKIEDLLVPYRTSEAEHAEPRISNNLRIGDNRRSNRPKLFLQPTMKYYYLVYVTNIINMFITAITIPLDVAYLIEYSRTYLVIESLCLLESIINIVIKFRTAVLLRGPIYSYKFRDILNAYWNSGLLFDIFGLAPFSVIFSYLNVREPLYLVLILKLLRVAIIFNVVNAINHIQLINYRISSIMSIFAIFSGFIFLLHFSSAMWYFANNQIEKDEPLTWEKHNKLTNSPLIEKMAYSIYYTTKIVTGVGSGDSFATTNFERILTCVMVHIGIVLFTVVFGLIAALTSSWAYEMEAYLSRKTQLDDFAEAFHLSDKNKRQLLEYNEYIKDMYYDPNTYIKAKELLPIPLVNEIVYETNKNFLLQIFKGIGCLNFIKKLAYRIETEHYLPGDYIMCKGDVGEEAYYIADGEASIIESDKRTVFGKLKKGVHFGEIGLFLKCRRTYYVQAKTHCSVYILKRSEVLRLVKKFPEVEIRIREHSEMLLSKIRDRETRIVDNEEEQLKDLNTIVEQSEDLKEELKEEFKEPSLTIKDKKYFERISFNEHETKQRTSIHNLGGELNRLMNVESGINIGANMEIVDRLEENKSVNDIENIEFGIRNQPVLRSNVPRRRLSQLTFGKHLKLSENTEVELRWTVLKNPHHESSIHKS